MKKIIFFLLLPFLMSSQSNYNLSLLGTLDWNNTEGSDIWGWADGIGNEYALVGLNNGFSVVNVTTPTNPVEEFFISDINSTWRDVKTFGHYAYVTTEANAGLLIVDLSDMSGNTYFYQTIFNGNNSSTEFTAAHNLYIDENGVAYIFGASSNSGSSPADGAIFLDVATNPIDPSYLGEWNDFYIHDGMVRGDTMYVGCIYEGELYIVDVSNKNNPQNLGHTTTPSSFTHNAWVSNDGNYVFTTDEQSDAYVGSYNITDMNNIQEVDRIQSNPGSNSIPHNAHVDGNFLITSWYRDGTVVHDITYPNNMIEVANYDSYAGSGDGFDGCWGTYPFLPSGNIISSDINSNNSNNARLLVYSRDFQQASYLDGNVSDITNSLPIASANIEILNTLSLISTSSDISGNYSSGIASTGNYDIVFSAAGYLSDTLNTNLSSGIITTVDIQLQPLVSFNTSGIVVDINGNGIENADVLIYNNDNTFTVTTDNLGNFNLNNIYEGNYNIIAGHWGYITVCSDEYISSSNPLQPIVLSEGYYDDFTFNFGWSVSGGIFNPNDGIWQRGNPEGTSDSGINYNPEDDVDNDCFENAYVTGLEAGTQTGSRDVDDFNTILTSPILDLSGNQDYILNYDVWFSNGFSWGAPPNDSLTVSVSNGATNVVIDILTASSNNLGEWSSKSFDLSQIISLNNNIQFSIETADWDALGGHWVEGGFDNFYISNSLPSNIIENINDNKKLIKVIDILGRESNFNSQLPLIYIYDDGSIEKRIIIK
jgi:choice-of-anchor B domain-containing protein